MADEWPSLLGQAEETDAPPGWEPDQALQSGHGWDEPAQPSQPQQQLNVGAKDFAPPAQMVPYVCHFPHAHRGTSPGKPAC